MRILRTAAASLALTTATIAAPALANMEEISKAVEADYDSYLEPLFVHFHKNPELSFLENKTAERMAADNWSGYLSILRDNPIATKAATSATVYTIGDVIAQRTEGESMGSLDRPRILRSLLAGLIGHGPMSHFWYEISENMYVNVLHLTQWWSFVPKVAVDQTLWGPVW